MKRALILAILVCAVAAFAFADSFVVQDVKGRVVRDSGRAITVGETLNSDVVIKSDIGASLVLKDAEGKNVTISGKRDGSIADLTRASSGVRIGGNVARTDTTAATRTVAQAGTASARASDAAGDSDIAAE